MEKPKLGWRRQLICAALLVAIVWFGNFSQFERFSLYADDLSYLGSIFFYPNTFQTYLGNIPRFSDGRPIQYGLIDLTGAIMTATDSFGPAYLFLFVLTAASVLATWWALTYRFSNAVAFTAAALLALSPLVSIRPFLNGIASPAAVLLLMIASRLSVSRWRIAAYLVSALILLSYELTFPVFVLLPALLKPLRSRSDLYRLIGHAVICAAMIGGYAVLKSHLGSARVEDALAGHSATAIVAGVLSVIYHSFVYGLWGGINLPLWLRNIESGAGVILWGGFAFLAFIPLLIWLAPRSEDRADAEHPMTVQTMAVLLLMVLAGYSLVYFGAPEGAHYVMGRGSRFHSVAALPWSILGAVALWQMFGYWRRPWLRAMTVTLGAAYFALIFAFSVAHQDDFAKEAERQRLLVEQLVRDHPLMDRNATFMVEEPMLSGWDLPAIEYEDGHSFYYLLPNLFDFGPEIDGRRGPAIRLVEGDYWPQALAPGKDDRLEWPSGAWPPNPELAGHVWVYEFSLAGALTPKPGPVLIGGRNILHEGPDVGEGLVDLRRAKRQPLFHLLMGPEAEIIDAALRRGAAQ